MNGDSSSWIGGWSVECIWESGGFAVLSARVAMKAQAASAPVTRNPATAICLHPRPDGLKCRVKPSESQRWNGKALDPQVLTKPIMWTKDEAASDSMGHGRVSQTGASLSVGGGGHSFDSAPGSGSQPCPRTLIMLGAFCSPYIVIPSMFLKVKAEYPSRSFPSKGPNAPRIDSPVGRAAPGPAAAPGGAAPERGAGARAGAPPGQRGARSRTSWARGRARGRCGPVLAVPSYAHGSQFPQK